MANIKICFTIILLCLSQVYGAKILMIFNVISRSHSHIGQALGLGLAEKGHEVTMFSPFKSTEKHSRYKEILIETVFLSETAKLFMNNPFALSKQSMFEMMRTMTSFGIESANGTFYHEEMQNIINSGAKFDVLITEVFMNECLFSLSHYFGAVPVTLSTFGTSFWTDMMVGNPYNPAYNVNPFLGYGTPFTYLQRMANTAHAIFENIMYWKHISDQQPLYDDYSLVLHKGDVSKVPSFTSLIRNVSLVLLNSNYIVSDAQALVPNMINVGGIHIKNKTLPSDLQKILDDAKDGAVYFSMGSNLKSVSLATKIRNEILQTFSKLNKTVLWKWEEDKLPNQPANVVIRPWMPQQSILAHPNVEAFITHGGLLSSIESLYFGKPMIGIPVFGDQPKNMARAVKSGYAVKLDLEAVSEETLTEALTKILTEPKYRLRAQELSRIFQDEPQSPLEKAISSIEYVLRHKGAPFLRSAAADMPVYQTLLLDVIAGLTLIVALPILLAYWMIKKIILFFVIRRGPKISTHKKKN